jgi:hypothetical protein
MNKKLAALIATMIVGGSTSALAAQNYILHFQGRSWSAWQANKASTSGTTIYESRSNSSVWSDVTLSYDGNARIANATVDGAINSSIRSHCGTATNNTCIIHCYSAGCMRAKKAITDIRNGTVGGAADTLAGLLYMEGSGNASGGTDLAEVSTAGFTGFISKIMGQQAAVDKDLTRSAARTTYSWIHTGMPVQFWNMAGHLDTCKKVLFVKICGGSHIAGTSDGVVPWASSGGYSSSAAVTSMCSVSSADEQDKTKNVTGKYPKHRTDTFYETCAGNDSSGASWDHAGIVNAAETGIDMVIHNTTSAYYYYDPYTDPSPPATACSGSQCDGAMASGVATDTTKGYDSSNNVQNNGASISSTGPMTAGTTGSTTSCVGRCGTNPGGSYCRCDQASGACSDYTAQHCDSVNQ